MVTHQICGNSSGYDISCSSTTYQAGTLQSFELSTTVVVSTDYFAVPANQGDTIGFSMTATNVTTFQGYFVSGAGLSLSSPASLIVNGSGTQFENQTGNYQAYSSSVVAPQTGAYVFVFSVPAKESNDSANFILLDSAAYDSGITIAVGTSNVQYVIVNEHFPGGGGGSEGFGWTKIPITVYAPSTTAVNLTSLTLGRSWLEIVPPYLPDVGPQGTNATVYYDGEYQTGNSFTTSLFIGATGADGLTGGAILQVEGSSDVHVVSGLGPISLSGGGLPDIVGLVYDPLTSPVTPLSVTVSVAGLLEQNGSIIPLPSWLDVSYPTQNIVFGNGSTSVTYYTTLGNGNRLGYVPQYEIDNVTYNSLSSNFSFVLQPYSPYYFVLNIDSSSAPKADQGIATVVLDETVDGQHFVSRLRVDTVPIQPVGDLFIEPQPTSNDNLVYAVGFVSAASAIVLAMVVLQRRRKPSQESSPQSSIGSDKTINEEADRFPH